MRVLICGQRSFTNKRVIWKELAKLPDDTVVVHGGAKGADTLAGEIAEALRLTVEVFPAQWTKYGKAAGPIRNERMLREGKPDLILAFYHDPAMSKGTKNMVAQAHKAGVPVREIIV